MPKELTTSFILVRNKLQLVSMSLHWVMCTPVDPFQGCCWFFSMLNIYVLGLRGLPMHCFVSFLVKNIMLWSDMPVRKLCVLLILSTLFVNSNSILVLVSGLFIW